ncbi:uncharacterized protein V6R79_008922 [Siganus canaliculatus]
MTDDAFQSGLHPVPAAESCSNTNGFLTALERQVAITKKKTTNVPKLLQRLPDPASPPGAGSRARLSQRSQRNSLSDLLQSHNKPQHPLCRRLQLQEEPAAGGSSCRRLQLQELQEASAAGGTSCRRRHRLQEASAAGGTSCRRHRLQELQEAPAAGGIGCRRHQLQEEPAAGGGIGCRRHQLQEEASAAGGGISCSAESLSGSWTPTFQQVFHAASLPRAKRTHPDI